MAYRWLGVLALTAACSFGCENTGSGGPPFEGAGGVGGFGGEAGAGGAGGVGGAGGSQISCVTSALCLACPTNPVCDTSQDCSIGFTCIESGCDTLEGAPIGHCLFVGGGACETSANCSVERECIDIPDEGKRCIKTTPGCNTDSDCVVGFNCEGDSCVDRRVPCDLDADCPKSHFCHKLDATAFCRRVHQSCSIERDCADIAPRCDDIDGDGTKECASVFNPNELSPQACLNTMCPDSTPVCELGDAGFTDCGRYGLCTGAGDCVDGFECVGLWFDGRSECVPTGGSCSHISDCPERQVCASPRGGGPPSCQEGYQP